MYSNAQYRDGCMYYSTTYEHMEVVLENRLCEIASFWFENRLPVQLLAPPIVCLFFFVCSQKER